MTFLESILLGILQGLTEFLPISSSGHLTLFGAWLGVGGEGGDPYHLFVVATHFGTLLAIVIYYRNDLLRLLAALWRSLPRGLRAAEGDEMQLRLAGILIVATLPAVICGLLGGDWLRGLFEKPLSAALMLIATGFILLSARWTGPRAAGGVGWRNGVAVGLAQALAILPGISRSGSTIAMGLATGIAREEAARYAFLLAVPALLGAAVLELAEIDTLAAVNWPVILAGTLAAFLSGYLALVWLIRLLSRALFWKFSFYCWGVGILALGLILGGKLG